MEPKEVYSIPFRMNDTDYTLTYQIGLDNRFPKLHFPNEYSHLLYHQKQSYTVKKERNNNY